MTRTGDFRFNGLCKSCMRRFRCPKGLTYLDLQECKAYKTHGLRKETDDGRNKTNERAI